MTNKEMQYIFDMKYVPINNKILTSYDKNILLNEAYRILVLEMFKKGFENSELEKNITSKLKADSEITTGSTAGYYPNSIIKVLPTNCWFLLNERADLSFTGGDFDGETNTDIPIKPIDEDYYNLNKNNPYKAPDHNLVWRISTAGSGSDTKRVELIVGDSYTTIDSYYISYIKNITEIDIIDDVDCEIPDESFHEKIVNEAIRLAYIYSKDMRGTELGQLEKKNQEINV